MGILSKTDKRYRHGLSRTVEYAAWDAMIQRCYNKNNPKYVDYGGRGITVCSEWRENFLVFYTAMGKKPFGTSLDRIENDGNYEPSNCKWSTYQEQIYNRRKYKTNKSGTTGVHFDKKANKWCVRTAIKGTGKRVFIGYFDTRKEAENGRLQAA